VNGHHGSEVFSNPPTPPPSSGPNGSSPRRETTAGISHPYQYMKTVKERMELDLFWSDLQSKINDRKKKGTYNSHYSYKPHISGNGIVRTEQTKKQENENQNIIVIKDQYSNSHILLKPPIN
jgi:hypothetical protein